MPYKTRPYVGLPFIPNFLRSYEIDNKTARVVHAFKSAAETTIQLPLESAVPQRQMINLGGLLDFGNVAVGQQGGGTFIFNNINGIAAFIDALTGKQTDVKHTIDVQPPKPSVPLWFKGFTDNDLENFEVRMPLLHRTLYFAVAEGLYALLPHPELVSPDGNVDHVTNTVWVRKGEPIMRYKSAKILSPCTGRVTYHAPLFFRKNCEEWSFENHWPESLHDINSYYVAATCLVCIQPLKNTGINTDLSECYADIMDVLQVVLQNPKRYLKEKDYAAIWSEDIRKLMVDLSRAKFRKGPVSYFDNSSGSKNNTDTLLSDLPSEVSL